MHISLVDGLDAAEDLAAAAYLGDDLFLHEIKAHGDEGHADDQVHGAEDEAQLDTGRTVERIARHQIAQTGRAQTDETEIGTVQKVPFFPLTEQHGPAAHVAGHHHQTDGDGHRRCLIVAASAASAAASASASTAAPLFRVLQLLRIEHPIVAVMTVSWITNIVPM